MKARMMWMGAVVGVLALTGCKQRDNPSLMEGQDTPQQQGAQDSRGETGGSGGMIPEGGVEEHTIGGIGGGTDAKENAMGGSGTGGGGKPDAGMASDAGTGGSGLESGDETDDGSMRRTPEKDRELQERQQSGDPDSNL